MKKYFDNIIFYLQRSGGGSVYWGEMVKRFNEDSLVNFIQPNLESSNIVLKDLKLRPVIKELNIPLKFLRYLPVTCKIEENSIFHSSYYRVCNQKNVKNIVTIHDFIYERFSKGLSKFVHNKQKGWAVKGSKGIICISNSTKDDLLRFFPDLVRTKQITVIYNGVSQDFKVINDKGSLFTHYSDENFKYILYVGHRTTYKNFDFAIQVIKELPKNYKLAIVGNKLNEVEMQCLTKNIPDKFIFFGNVSNLELNNLYNVAECLLYPSSYEGFGIPVLEAFQSGCPVVAQDIPSVREISEKAAILVNGLDLSKFKDSIISLSKDTLRTNLITIGLENVKKYSWNKCFREVNDFYRSI